MAMGRSRWAALRARFIGMAGRSSRACPAAGCVRAEPLEGRVFLAATVANFNQFLGAAGAGCHRLESARLQRRLRRLHRRRHLGALRVCWDGGKDNRWSRAISLQGFFARSYSPKTAADWWCGTFRGATAPLPSATRRRAERAVS